MLKIKVLQDQLLKIKDCKAKIQQNNVFYTTLKAAIINKSTSIACTEYSV